MFPWNNACIPSFRIGQTITFNRYESATVIGYWADQLQIQLPNGDQTTISVFDAQTR
jgi:hypothetical protein